MARAATVALLISWLAAGCSSDAGPGTPAVDGASGSPDGSGGGKVDGGVDVAGAFCKAEVDRRTRCNQTIDPVYETCGPEVRALMARFRTDFGAAYASCVQTLACDQSLETCMRKALTETVPGYETDPELLACTSAREGCKKAGEVPFSSEACYIYFTLSDAVQSIFKDCLKRPCKEMAGCVDAVVDFD